MIQRCGTAIIGAGPYGLSLGAHLRARGVDFRIFGRPLDAWRAHMPKDMFLKSEGFASNLSAPQAGSTIDAFCSANKIAYADRSAPISLDTFLRYGDWFRSQFVPDIDEVHIDSLEQTEGGYLLKTEDGRSTLARDVVIATDVGPFSYTPPMLAHLPAGAVSHSYDHRTFERFSGQDVIVVGAGSSAIDIAWQLREAGASVRIVARARTIEYNSVPDPDADTILYRLQNPPSPIGRGWRSYFCAAAPLLFYRLPQHLKTRAIESHLHAAGGWFMRERVEDRVPALLGRHLVSANFDGVRVALETIGPAGERASLECDHVIAATGYRVDMHRLGFLAPSLRKRVSPDGRSPHLTDNFQTRVPGLYTIGLLAMESFGPLLRFMVGAEFVAPRLAAHLQRRNGASALRRAA